MEFSSLAFGTIAFFLFLYFYFRRYFTSKHKPLPEPTGALPFLGHLHLLRGGGELPHFKFGALADQHGPIFNMRIGVHRMAVVSCPKVVKELFTSNDVAVSSRPKLRAFEHMGHNFSAFNFSPYGDYWRQIRKLTSLEVLSNRRVESLSPVCAAEITQTVKELFNLWEEEKNGSGQVLVDMKKWFISLNLNVVMKLAAGKRLADDGDDLRRCRKVIREFVHLAGMFLPADAFPWLRWCDFGGYERRMKETANEMYAIVGSWVEEHRLKGDCGGDKAEDFMDAMISAAKDSDFGGLHDAETVIISTCEVIIFGASETTSTTLIWILSLLLNHRHALIKVQQELDKHVGRERRVNKLDIHNLVYLHAVIKETLRLYPAVPLVTRELIEDCTIAGYDVPKGSWLMLNLWKMQRDPKMWPDNPLEFKPERFLTMDKNTDSRDFKDFTFLPFGAGRRICPGVNLALHELPLVMATLLQGFDITTVSSEKVDMTESAGLTNVKATPLDVLIAPRLSHDLY